MTSGICPKCGSKRVHRLMTLGYRSYLSVGVTIFSRARLADYVCCVCGYVESYVMHQRDLENIAKKGEWIDPDKAE